MDTIGLAVVEVEICSLDVLLLGDPNKLMFSVAQQGQICTIDAIECYNALKA